MIQPNAVKPELCWVSYPMVLYTRHCMSHECDCLLFVTFILFLSLAQCLKCKRFLYACCLIINISGHIWSHLLNLF